MKNHSDLEEQIRSIGSTIYSMTEGETPSLFDGKRWKGKVMEAAMKDEASKVQLFRFIDVLPSLKSDSLVVELLNEYMAQVDDAPLMLKQLVGRISGDGLLLPHVTAKVIRAGVESFAKQFIGGRHSKDALVTLDKLRKDGLAFTVDLLGEKVLSDEDTHEYSHRYLELLETIALAVKEWQESPILDRDDQGAIPRLDVSLKVSSFYSQLDPMSRRWSIRKTVEGLTPIFQKAGEVGASVTVDMEHYHVKDLTIAIFKEMLDANKSIQFAGLALQVYLKDSRDDVEGLIEWAKASGRRIGIRLVKGAYWDYETTINRQLGWPVPVFLNKEETDFNFEDLTKLLLENHRYIRLAIATHNLRSISHAIAFAESLSLPKEAFEFQVIYGMAEPIRRALIKMGYRVRVYTPIGELIPGMAYLIRRLLENTSNESFLRKSFAEEATFNDLIKAPRATVESPEPSDFSVEFQNEPTTDFSITLNRSEMEKALATGEKEFGKRYPLVIAGKEVRTEKTITSFNPTRPNEVIGTISSASQKEAVKAIKVARKYWAGWRATSTAERADYLRKAAQEMRSRRFDLMALEVFEVGKTWQEADGDIAEAIDFLEFYALEMERLGLPRRLGAYPGEENLYVYDPRGVGVVISPWNFPIAIPTGMISAALVAGNCVIFKPSGLSSVCGWKLVEIFRSVSLPGGVLQLVAGPGGSVGEFLVSHPDIDFIAFTGSQDVGLRLVRLAGETQPGQRNVKRVIAEMGGKNAIIVDETADPDEAVSGILKSTLGFQGQKCSACSRVIVVGEQYDEFCARLKEAMESVEIGPPEDPKNYMGPVVDEAARSKIQRYIEMGKQQGKPILIKETDHDGNFIGPAVFADVDPDAPIAQEEIFGPVVVVIKADDIDRALEIANSTAYALTGGLYSRSPANIEKVKKEFIVGNLYINRKITGALVGRQPFGGFRMSGIGSKTGGPDYLLQFMHTRCISENTMRRGFSPDYLDGIDR